MDFMVGQIFLSALNFAPSGTLLCNGQRLSIGSYPELFEAIGTTYGGDGVTTFVLPNIPPVSVNTGPPLNWTIVTDGAPYGSGMECFMGEVRLFPTAPPPGSQVAQTWLPCNGQLINITEDPAGFALLGTTFGGNGTSTYALPKLAPLEIPNGPPAQWWIANAGQFPPTGGDSTTPKMSGQSFDLYMAMILQLPYQPSIISAQIGGLGYCLGQTMLISDWTALFSLLGTNFGGNGTSNFLLPNRPTGSDHITYAMVLNGLFPPRT